MNKESLISSKFLRLETLYPFRLAYNADRISPSSNNFYRLNFLENKNSNLGKFMEGTNGKRLEFRLLLPWKMV